MLTLFKKFKIVKYYSLYSEVIVKGLWLNSKQTTEEEVIYKHIWNPRCKSSLV